jgi:uncharacterized membrane protein
MTKKITSYVGWAIVLAASVYFIVNSALSYLPYNKPRLAGAGFLPNFAPWILVHIVAGMTALLLGPFQFIPSIRKKYPRTHRFMGKTYLICVLIAACTSLEVSVLKIIIGEKGVVFGLGLFVLGLVWLLTSGMAYWSARSRNFVQHREWMVRSFVVTCAFTTFRLSTKLMTEKFGVDGNAAADLMAWASWSVPLIVAELFLQGSKIRKGNAALANKKQQAVSIVSDSNN